MKFIPAVSIKGGHVAIAQGGTYRFLRNDDGLFRSPVNLIREMNFPGEEIFILDIDGLERNSPDLETVKRIAAHRDTWLDAGTPDSESMMDLFVSDATKVVLSTLTLTSLGELRKSLEMSDNIIFSVAYDSGVVSPDPRLSGMGLGALIRELGDLSSLRAGMLFDLGSLRDGKPVATEPVSALAGFFEELYVSGYATAQDAEALGQAGAAGLIVDFRRLGELTHE